MPTDRIIHLTVDQRERRYLLHVPPGGQREPLPVVLMLHGSGATSSWTRSETQWDALADRERFIVTYPEALPYTPDQAVNFLKNPTFWSNGARRLRALSNRPDDVAFINHVLDDLPNHAPLDDRRVYVTGFSNGAGMTFRLAAELTERFAAVAPVAGHCGVQNPQPTRPIPTLFLIGRADPLVPYEGGEFPSPWGGRREVFPPVRETLVRWATALGCTNEPELVRDESGIRVERYRPAEFWAYTIEGLGHHWPGGRGRLNPKRFGSSASPVSANEVIWQFFREKVR